MPLAGSDALRSPESIRRCADAVLESDDLSVGHGLLDGENFNGLESLRPVEANRRGAIGRYGIRAADKRPEEAKTDDGPNSDGAEGFHGIA
jgi:hypothetical protein